MAKKPTTATKPAGPELPYRGQCDLVLSWADGTYRFALGLPQIRELERLSGLGILALYGKVMRGRFEGPGGTFGFAMDGLAGADDIRETIRLALIGGGEAIVGGEITAIDPNRAVQLVEAYCPPAMPAEGAWTLAAAVLDALVHGREPREPTAAETDAAVKLGSMMASAAGRGEGLAQ